LHRLVMIALGPAKAAARTNLSGTAISFGFPPPRR
jgi:hypothetical protein